MIQGASSRLRAIALTSVTTIGGLIPLSLSGGPLFAQLGWAVIFGLTGSSVMHVVVQPVAYMAFDSRRKRGQMEKAQAGQQALD